MVSAEALMFLLWQGDGSAAAMGLSLVPLQRKGLCHVGMGQGPGQSQDSQSEVGTGLFHAMLHNFVSIFPFFSLST